MSGLTLLQPEMLWGLVLVPALLGLNTWIRIRRRAALRAFGELRLIHAGNPELRGLGSARSPVWLLPAAAMLLVLALARPAGHPRFLEENALAQGTDLMLVLDLSSSMRATDLKPNRLQAVKEAVRQFLDGLHHDRVGLVVFAGTHALQAPLTRDTRTIRMMLDILSTEFLPVDGTAAGDAIAFAVDRLTTGDRHGGVLILLTDGENTKGMSPLEALPKAKTAGIRIYTIGVGTAEGAPIPNGQDESGRELFKTYQGQTVIAKVDEATLRRLAEETGGRYFPAVSVEALNGAYAEIARLSKSEFNQTNRRVEYDEYFIWLLAPAILLLVAEVFLSRRTAWRIPWLERFHGRA